MIIPVPAKPMSDAGIEEKAEILNAALKKLDKDALNKFIVVDRLKIRFRSHL